MQKFTIAVTFVLTLAAATMPAGAQEEAYIKPSLHQSGCIDFSAEYEGCLSFGPRPEEEATAVYDDSNRLRVVVSSNPNTSSREPPIATTSPALGNLDVP